MATFYVVGVLASCELRPNVELGVVGLRLTVRTENRTLGRFVLTSALTGLAEQFRDAVEHGKEANRALGVGWYRGRLVRHVFLHL